MNRRLPSYETIRYHRIVAHDFSQETGEAHALAEGQAQVRQSEVPGPHRGDVPIARSPQRSQRRPANKEGDALSRHRFAPITEPLTRDGTFLARAMFGCVACYLSGRLVLVLADRGEPWQGLLIPSERSVHASILAIIRRCAFIRCSGSGCIWPTTPAVSRLPPRRSSIASRLATNASASSRRSRGCRGNRVLGGGHLDPVDEPARPAEPGD